MLLLHSQEKGVTADDAIQAGMQEMSEAFKEHGAEVYVPVDN